MDPVTIGLIGSSALGALGGLFGGGDDKKSEKLTEEQIKLARLMANIELENYHQNSPLRDAFRQGVMGLGDPTNPFSKLYNGGQAPQPPTIGPYQAPEGPPLQVTPGGRTNQEIQDKVDKLRNGEPIYASAAKNKKYIDPHRDEIIKKLLATYGQYGVK